MRVALATLSLVATLTPAAVFADKLGEQPSVVTQRIHAVQRHDESRFHSRPSWLHVLIWLRLLAEAQRATGHPPTAIVAEHERQRAPAPAPAAPPGQANEQ